MITDNINKLSKYIEDREQMDFKSLEEIQEIKVQDYITTHNITIDSDVKFLLGLRLNEISNSIYITGTDDLINYPRLSRNINAIKDLKHAKIFLFRIGASNNYLIRLKEITQSNIDEYIIASVTLFEAASKSLLQHKHLCPEHQSMVTAIYNECTRIITLNDGKKCQKTLNAIGVLSNTHENPEESSLQQNQLNSSQTTENSDNLIVALVNNMNDRTEEASKKLDVSTLKDPTNENGDTAIQASIEERIPIDLSVTSVCNPADNQNEVLQPPLPRSPNLHFKLGFVLAMLTLVMLTIATLMALSVLTGGITGSIVFGVASLAIGGSAAYCFFKAKLKDEELQVRPDSRI